MSYDAKADAKYVATMNTAAIKSEIGKIKAGFKVTNYPKQRLAVLQKELRKRTKSK